jgi:hypothetical protein
MVPDVRYFFPDLCPSLRILSLAKPERPAGRFFRSESREYLLLQFGIFCVR